MTLPEGLNHNLVLTVSEVAALLSLERAKVYLFIQENLLEAFKLGSEWRIRTESVRNLLSQMRTPGVGSQVNH